MNHPFFARVVCIPLATAMAAGSIVLPAQAAEPDAAQMSPEEKIEQAKKLYKEATAALEAGDATTALSKFEDAYNKYAPDLHKFNFNIAQAAYEAGDCVKARAAFQRFLDLVPEDANRGTAQVKILEIDRSGCAQVAAPTTSPAPAPTAVETPPGLVASDTGDDAPMLTSRRREREQVIERERDEEDAKRVDPLLVSGAVLAGVGVAGIIGGGVSAALANKKAKELADLAGPGPTGFPPGNYATEHVFNLDRNKLPNNNVATVVLFGVGSATLVTGAALLAVWGVKKKRAKRRSAVDTAHRAGLKGGPRLGSVGPTWLPGGAGATAAVHF